MKDGGPAFATTGGMSLRDYFAAAALQSLISYSNEIPFYTHATLAYQYADAMLAEREKTS